MNWAAFIFSIDFGLDLDTLHNTLAKYNEFRVVFFITAIFHP